VCVCVRARVAYVCECAVCCTKDCEKSTAAGMTGNTYIRIGHGQRTSWVGGRSLSAGRRVGLGGTVVSWGNMNGINSGSGAELLYYVLRSCGGAGR
jgi:hypothetical protein